MKLQKTPLPGSCLIELDKRSDDRGFFARLFCEREFAGQHLENKFPQINNSVSLKKGTLRGLHYQLPPSAEVKIVRCVRGALWDVIVDLRPDSPAFLQSYGAELSADNRLMMYVPRGFAHAFLTLTDDAETIYLVSAPYDSGRERGLRWNDPAFVINWPFEPAEISMKDANWPDLEPEFHAVELLRGVT